jgi:hypothetical protein
MDASGSSVLLSGALVAAVLVDVFIAVVLINQHAG